MLRTEFVVKENIRGSRVSLLEILFIRSAV